MSRIKENTDYESIFDDAVDEVTNLVQSSYKSFKTSDLHRLMVANLDGKMVYEQSDRQTAAKLLATQIDSSLLTTRVFNGAARRNKVMQHMVAEFCHTILGVEGSVIDMRDYTPNGPVDEGVRGWFARRGSKPETKEKKKVTSAVSGFGFFRRKSDEKEGKIEKQPSGKKLMKNSGGEDLKKQTSSESKGERQNYAPALLEHDLMNEEISDVDESPSTPVSLKSNEGLVVDAQKLTLKILKRVDNEVSDDRGNTVEIPMRGVSKARLHDPKNEASRSRYEEPPRSAPVFGSRDQSLEFAMKKVKPKKSSRNLKETSKNSAPPRERRPSPPDSRLSPREHEMRQVDKRFDSIFLIPRRQDPRSRNEDNRRKEPPSDDSRECTRKDIHERSDRERYIRQQHQDRNRGRSTGRVDVSPTEIFNLYTKPAASRTARSKSAHGRHYLGIPPPLDTSRVSNYGVSRRNEASPVSARGDSLRMHAPETRIDYRKGNQQIRMF
jgi:hypothetical protein